MQDQFQYDDQTITRLERSLSLERLQPYLELADDNRAYALQLYQWNTKISESLYSLLQGFEVTLRNSIHDALSAGYARQDWYEAAPLLAPERQRIEEAKRRIASGGREVNPGRVVAELMFGFWTSLVGTGYAQSLWDKELYKAFRDRPMGRKIVAKRVKTVRFLRNRVAHHESIIGRKNQERDLRKDVREILEATSWICQTTAQWIARNSSFDSNYSRRPARPEPPLLDDPDAGKNPAAVARGKLSGEESGKATATQPSPSVVICKLWPYHDRRFMDRQYNAWWGKCSECGRMIVVTSEVKKSKSPDSFTLICEQCADLKTIST